jgi:hypothetical protein
MIEAVDTYFLYVKQQMKLIDQNQKFGPIIASRDWPQTPPQDSTLYLLYLSSVPMSPSTASEVLYSHSVQWVWLVMGDDIAPQERKQNRGDRYRASMAMQVNLRNANFPGFCPKKSYASDKNGGISSVGYTSPAVGGASSVWWGTPKFIPRHDAERSGLLYGIGATEIYAYDDVSSAVAEPYPMAV